MNYKDIIGNIKNRNFENVYLFYGKEYYLIENAIKVFKESLSEGMLDFNLDIIDGRETAIDQVISSIETLPFMDDKKIVIVKDFELLKGKKKNFSDSDEKYFIDHIENIPDTTVLVFIVYGDIDKRKSLVKKIDKKGIVFNCDKLSDMDLFKWVRKKFELNNVIVENSEIMYFIEQEGYRDKSSEKTLSDLENEINKISSFVGKGNIVSREVIDKLSQKKVENDIFKLIDYIGEKNSSNAMKILNDMINEGESVLGIFSMIARQFKVVVQSRKLQSDGYTSKVIAEKLKIHPFVATKAIKQSRNFSDEIIIDMLNYILECDYKIKNGLIRDTLAVEMLVSKYCKREFNNVI
ncbi:DNA polymerase III subunit delta [Romboutsia hominis]|uniref:DNA polymerase III subunit delta n=1 Tax=Romboutsia hominis TaxID=1507512 RepID=UPI001F05C9EF|nr:DNA polymerase III subunit delta [Romboutsia hominis]MCH1959260.1 DNA polymerase III subunit delta [Romboutsia hominis]MCH1970158.1 DNA polymerase III subunit delta [Romboutsia hominis]